MHPSSESAHLASRTWETVGRPVLLVPIGSTEQHGPHLPLDTDTLVATTVADRAASELRDDGLDAVVAPAIAYGASGEHQDFPGTISIGREALTLLLVEFGRSACEWAGRLVFVNGHGGNVESLTGAVRQLRDEGRDAAWLSCSPDLREAASRKLPRDAHAGRTETSLIAHLRPRDLRADRIITGETASLAEIMPRLRAEGVRAVSPTGVLGDPTGASPGEGRELLDAICAAAIRRLRTSRVTENGSLND
ncbi:mycofactocin biosynthesis peptidyl-dipeptidase MftE [Microbacterium sp.]|uniref:mycofactocin biosynthesis peptidyl-dipeptidase MftE n=1 Tax=Microbacterium sp. TaxID=51671 RepID=UPI0025F8CA1E|nr:mycofactocin biosynthesis peptidyl-dipeptidase MftE [Microbacterium sp.]